jgi:LemA protein
LQNLRRPLLQRKKVACSQEHALQAEGDEKQLRIEDEELRIQKLCILQREVRMRKVFLCIAIVAVVMSLTGCGYNTMQMNEEAVKAAWGDVEASYQRRNDLVPNLVEVVKGYAKHEKETLQAVTEARAKVGSIQVTKDMVGDPKAMAQFQAAQGQMSGALSRLMVVVEKYHDLKANQNFMDLQHQLEGTENRINVARVRYNKAVQEFNVSIRIFPNSLTNSMLLHLTPKEPFKAEAGAEKAPQVKF